MRTPEHDVTEPVDARGVPGALVVRPTGVLVRIMPTTTSGPHLVVHESRADLGPGPDHPSAPSTGVEALVTTQHPAPRGARS